ncbi:hypothetical protein [Pararhodobacter sp. CCB-MM2]|uniref:hypothetical protein n=1 Tax=Pararhodobacter sp. CCB-MM2 TaxID=1786003 RepID=UPI0008332511|nr:hypothetical protein [Pararhodobacter sp. CCB-MM2]
MNAVTKHDPERVALTGLELLRQPFPANQISKLPKPTRKQTEAVQKDFTAGISCKLCGAWHHPDVVHLDYVGHAALTDRLLDCDPAWNWEPLAFTPMGTPALDDNGGMWIKLTICGVSRFGYGHPDGKRGGDAIKEVIGDALRNAAMRFGAALDLWHKGDLHGHDAGQDEAPGKDSATAEEPAFDPKAAHDRIQKRIANAPSFEALSIIWGEEAETVKKIGAAVRDLGVAIYNARDARKADLAQPVLADDEIPY